jgi:bacterioferritin
MKGNEKVIAALNDFLSDELTAINQYIVHSEMCANWGYEKLHNAAEKRAIEEMKHAEKLIARILFLEGLPVVSNLKKMNIGATVDEQLKNDWEAEAGAIKAYNDGIKLCLELGDNGSRELIDSNLTDEENHLDWLEAQLDQIKQMGLQNYLLGQTS